MSHLIEAASTGRSQCRACGLKIAKDELRFGERGENAFGEGESTMWFHPLCAAYSRPEQLLELMNEQSIDDNERLRKIADEGVAHPKLPRLKGAERAPTGRATCKQCQQLIAKDDWRLALAFFEEFRFNAGGFIHASCAGDYFGTRDVMQRIRHFNPSLSAADLEAVRVKIKAAS